MTPWTAAHRAPLSFTISQNLLKFMPMESVMLSDHSSSAAPFPFAFSLSQHQGTFQWINSSYQVAKVPGLWLQHLSLQWIFRVDFLQNYWFVIWANNHITNTGNKNGKLAKPQTLPWLYELWSIILVNHNHPILSPTSTLVNRFYRFSVVPP